MRDWTADDRRAALEWAHAALDRLGRTPVGDAVEFHVRPWSTIFRIPTRAGSAYLKAVPARLRHEVALTEWLARRFPDRVVGVLAADVERGLMLLPEGGTVLRELPFDARRWERLAREYAELELEAAPRVPELLSLGAPDRRLAGLPAALAAVLPPSDQPLVARYAELCGELAAVDLPETIQMDDLHDGNVFVDGDQLRVFDWGDASVAHPFHGLGMLLTMAARRSGLARKDAAILRLRDSYLESFADRASMIDLRRAAELAERVTPTVRIGSWLLGFEGVPPEEQGRWGETLNDLIEQQRAALSDRPRAPG